MRPCLEKSEDFGTKSLKIWDGTPWLITDAFKISWLVVVSNCFEGGSKYFFNAIFAVEVEDITWPRGDTKFLFKCWKIFHEWVQRTNEIFFQQEKRNVISPSDHVMFFLLHIKRQWNTKQFYSNSFLVWKVRFIIKP